MSETAPMKTGNDARRERLRRLAASQAILGAALSVLAAGIMVAAHLLSADAKPPVSPGLEHMRAQLAQNPGDENLKEAIRKEDLRLRTSYFRRRALFRRGAYLLAAGLILCVACSKWHFSLRSVPPPARPPAPSDDEARASDRRSRLAARAFGAAAFAGLLVAAGVGVRSAVSERAGPAAGAAPAPATAAAEAASSAFKDNWPRFRGPDGLGLAPAGAWPTDWDGAGNRNIRWKCPLPAEGKSSPVIWGSRVFLTAGDQEAQRVLCVDRTTGRLLWSTTLRRPPPLRVKRGDADAGEDEPLRVPQETGWAAPTPVTDGQFVYVTFATADVACFDLNGNQVWARNFGKPDSAYGLASSLVLHKGLLIYQLDQGSIAEDNLSALYGLDARTGDTIWRTPRPVTNSWATPITFPGQGGPQLVTVADPFVIAYDAELGTEIWRAKGISGDVASSAAWAGGIVFAATAHAKLLAIRPDGSGDVTQTHVAWEADQGLPELCSPVSDGELLLLVAAGGDLTTYDVKTGKVIWEEHVDGDFSASPTLAGRNVYLPDTKGKTLIFPLAREYKLIAAPDLGEGIRASPAFGDGCIYLRGEKHLYCIGPPEKPADADREVKP